MTPRKQPYTNTISTWFWTIAILVLIAASSCATTKRDCRGVRHTYNKKGGFYL